MPATTALALDEFTFVQSLTNNVVHIAGRAFDGSPTAACNSRYRVDLISDTYGRREFAEAGCVHCAKKAPVWAAAIAAQAQRQDYLNRFIPRS